ncbi:hypothetical protein G6F64_014138 [Rhizopus arrhizus]|uniref:Uncharacterized protein n=1 Tax=Rhizopus oryzae TaxID=64495 RepID=A0A9P6WUL0_RHIOR|nr:hypothetical protein G6F64_014138 [Rhizopus arrhizus]
MWISLAPRVVLRLQQVRHLGHVLQQPVQIDLVFGHAHDGRRVLGMAVGGRQQGLQRLVVDVRQRDIAVAAPDLAHRPIGGARADRQLHLPRTQRQHGALGARPGIGQGVRAHSSDSGSTATPMVTDCDTRIGIDASRCGAMPGYWRTAKDSTVAGGGRRIVAACCSGRRS